MLPPITVLTTAGTAAGTLAPAAVVVVVTARAAVVVVAGSVGVMVDSVRVAPSPLIEMTMVEPDRLRASDLP